jgi:hypothetical protein
MPLFALTFLAKHGMFAFVGVHMWTLIEILDSTFWLFAKFVLVLVFAGIMKALLGGFLFWTIVVIMGATLVLNFFVAILEKPQTNSSSP